MASVVLLSPKGAESTVTKTSSFNQLVSMGWRPKTGTLAANYATLAASGGAPEESVLEAVTLKDLQTPTSSARLILRAGRCHCGTGGRVHYGRRAGCRCDQRRVRRPGRAPGSPRVVLDFVAVTPTHATYAQHREDGAAEMLLQVPLDRWSEAQQPDHYVLDLKPVPSST